MLARSQDVHVHRTADPLARSADGGVERDGFRRFAGKPGRTVGYRASQMEIRGVRWMLRSRLAERPNLYLPVARLKYRDSVVNDATELVIDGFTRSAVTFATTAFQMSQDRPVRVAHTLHSAGHLVAAARRGLPTLVTIREPDETALSAVIREPYISLRHVLTAYARFYTKIEPYRSRFVIGTFDEITDDFGRVVRKVNERFGTGFGEFEHTEGNVNECYAIIEDRARRPPWSTALGEFECGIIGIDEYRRTVASFRERGDVPSLAVPERRVQRPSQERANLKGDLRKALEHPSLAGPRSRARRAYEAIAFG
jgi:hypothetical protein